mmetsp:Transcript_24737/g.62806  ORF Transcript_24737/g.62806 Transcript_24737/m.62806 type:complete len:293 (-) Transcript_24737:436-1314(-)
MLVFGLSMLLLALAPKGNAAHVVWGFNETNYESDIVSPELAEKVLTMERSGRGRMIVSMSLYGSHPHYMFGALENAVIIKRSWPEWHLRIYHDDTVPFNVLYQLSSLGAELRYVSDRGTGAIGMFWRFLPCGDRTVSRYIVRDADSRLTHRDWTAVSEWVKSDTYFHLMHDHPDHNTPIMGGMWGAVGGFINARRITTYLSEHSTASKGEDQTFLASVLYPAVRQYAMGHSSWFCKVYSANISVGFPTPRQHAFDFVGNVYYGPEWSGVKVSHSNMMCDDSCKRINGDSSWC